MSLVTNLVTNRNRIVWQQKKNFNLENSLFLNRFRAEIGLCSSYIFCYGSLIWEINKVPIFYQIIFSVVTDVVTEYVKIVEF